MSQMPKKSQAGVSLLRNEMQNINQNFDRFLQISVENYESFKLAITGAMADLKSEYLLAVKNW